MAFYLYNSQRQPSQTNKNSSEQFIAVSAVKLSEEQLGLSKYLLWNFLQKQLTTFYLLKVNNINTKLKSETCLKLTINKAECLYC